jgi:predicted PP-loop superfamily ATPase
MSFPKKGKSFPKSGDSNNSNGSLDGTIDFALEIASALERTLRDRNTRIKTVAGWTGANERTVKNWLSGQYGPCGAHLIKLIQHSDDVLNAVLSMGRRHDLVFAQKLGDVEQRMLGSRLNRCCACAASIPMAFVSKVSELYA